RMAIAMRREMDVLTESWRKRGYELAFGVGVAQGYATLGMIGFEGRVDYAAIGPATNLASRLCDQAQAGQILVSQHVYAAADSFVQAEHVGDLVLKGLRNPVPAFNVLGLKENI
ncbi:MAG: adenylate/guanylate cyclase domain-containing protein, partial [bacterium]|nr:adenylate/guanylate cyclase domain-containing protein [bacterium]